MATKTYSVGLYMVTYHAYKYIARWLPKLQENLTEEQLACVAALLNALQECLPLIKPSAPTD